MARFLSSTLSVRMRSSMQPQFERGCALPIRRFDLRSTCPLSCFSNTLECRQHRAHRFPFLLSLPKPPISRGKGGYALIFATRPTSEPLDEQRHMPIALQTTWMLRRRRETRVSCPPRIRIPLGTKCRHCSHCVVHVDEIPISYDFPSPRRSRAIDSFTRLLRA
jgi:hypothetical protein